MAKWLLLVLAAGALHAAVIRGVVVEHQSGRPLARALVVVAPLAGTPGVSLSTRTNVNGFFEFPSLGAGAWLVTASRRSFAPLVYGQKRWRAAGVPVVLAADGSAELNLRMQRFGSITGAVVDENDVGLPELEVIAYRNTRPPELVARAITDDRGMYRLWGLEPGSYLVRTAAKKAQDDNYLPTFSRETMRVDEARPVGVELDRETGQVTVRPAPGALYTITGQALVFPPVPATVTLVSDAGPQTATSDSSGFFHFDSLPPGSYEISAQAAARAGTLAAYAPLRVEREGAEVRLELKPLPDLQIQVEDRQGQPVDFALFRILARRKDLAGTARPEILQVKYGHVSLLPGRWELSMVTTPAYYVAQFVSGDGIAPGPAGNWNEITAAGPMAVKFVLSASPAVVRGTVSRADGAPAAAAPVYLETYDPQTRRRADLRQARTDLEGKYQFYGLAPGAYRILATFEDQEPGPEVLDAAKAPTLVLEESREVVIDLPLWVMP